MRVFFVLFFFCHIALADTCIAQERDTLPYTILHYTDEDGLPQNSVRSISGDENGYIWMTTENGLTRFDGSHFYVFDKSKINGLQSNRVSMMFRGWNNILYAITDKTECIAIQRGRAIRDTISPRQSNILPASLFTPGGSDYWTHGLPDGFMAWPDVKRYLIPAGHGRIIACTLNDITFSQPGSRSVRVVLPVSNLSGYFLLDGHLFHMDEKGTSFSTISPSGSRSCTLAGDAQLNQPGAPIKIFWNATSSDVLFYKNHRFYKMSVSTDGNLNAEFIADIPSLNIGQVSSCYYDSRYSRLFLGSLTKGLYVISRKQFLVLNERSHAVDDIYYAQVPYDENAVLTGQRSIAGTDNAGRPYIKNAPGNYYDNFSVAVHPASNGFWVKDRSLLSLLNHDLSVARSWKLPDVITVLYEAVDGTLWIGLRDKGLYRMNVAAGDNAPVYVLNAGRVSYLLAEQDHLWIGSTDGLSVWTPESRQWQKIDRLKGKYVRCIYVSEAGKVWISTYEDGIYLLSERKRLTHFPMDRDKLIATAHCITEDRNGFFWITTNKGLFQVAKTDLLNYADGRQKEVYYYYYGKDKGFNTNEFNGGCEPCSATLADGRISLPSLDGLVWFDPQMLKIELPDKELMVDHIVLDNKILTPTDTILLPRKFNQLQIQVSTPYLGNKRNVQISYALVRENGPVSWFHLGNERQISFPSLPSGNYKLHIRKINGFGLNDYSERIIRLNVAPRFYETFWFITLAGFLAVAGIFTYIRLRMLFVVKANRKLELRIAQRTRKLMNALRALESSESGLRRQTQIQEMLIAAISHDIKSPMKYLTLASEKMQKLLLRKEYESLPAFNQGIQDTASKVYVLLDNLLQYISVQLKKGEIKITPVNLFEIINEKSVTFKNIAELHFTTIQNEVMPNTVINTNRELLGVVVHNLIDNAVKNTLSGDIRIFTEKYNKGMILVIEDTGKGMPQSLADWLNTPNNNEMAIDTASGHMGMGLVIVKELVSLISARIFVDRREKGGTRISITLLAQP